MPAPNVAQATRPCSKPAGRPIDKAVAQFELALESVLALEDDALALEEIFSGLRHIRACTVKLEDHADVRIRRIRDHIQPELQRLVKSCDGTLTLATVERAARRACQKALEATS